MNAVPVQGQLVRVRSRRFVVADVQASTLPPDGAHHRDRQHFVTLRSVEDDGVGEELQVVWEIEPGARVFDHTKLPGPPAAPKSPDEPEVFDAFLDALRWGTVESADHRALHAPFRSGITIEDYQLDPVVRALQMPRVNLLLADDVGLGKTIEAGLVVQELMLRNRVRSVLVACPSGLQVQWRDQMREKFGLEFRIVNAELLRELRRQRGLFVNPWTHFPRLITSIDFLKRPPQMRRFRDVLPGPGEPRYPRRFDMLIVDEAHNIAPAGRAAGAKPSARTRAIEEISEHFEHRLFLSATPHNGYPESFQALLALIDDQRFHRGVPPDKTQLGTIMVRRLKSDLPPNADGTPRYPPRAIEPLRVEYTDEEREAHQWLKRYSDSRRKKAKAAQDEASGGVRMGTEFILKLLKKRFFSSPEAFATTLEKHLASFEVGFKTKRKKASTKLKQRVLARYLDEVEEHEGGDEDVDFDEAIEDATLQLTPLDDEEREWLDGLKKYAERGRALGDSKSKRLVEYLRGIVHDDQGEWTDERVIIFTEYRATQNWLLDVLAEGGLAEGERVSMLYGSMVPDDREVVKAAFQASPDDAEVRILLATDAASEGIDLQKHCARLVHYEIPWNPNRLEQRNGRVDRHGQKGRLNDDGERVVFIHHFVGGRLQRMAGAKPGDLEGDLEFLAVAANKVSQIREDLGRVGPVIARQVEEAMEGNRVKLDTAQAEEEAKLPRAMLKVERKHREDLERLRRTLDESEAELNATPERVERLVTTALDLAGQPRLTPAKVDDLVAFRVPALSGTWEKATEGLAHPHSHGIRPISFATVGDRDDVVWAHLNHRLVAMAVGLLRAEGWSGSERLSRFSVRAVPEIEAPVLIAFGRLVVHGGDQHKLHEELIAQAIERKGGRTRRLGVEESERLARLEGVPFEGDLDVEALWEDAAETLHTALQARTETRMEALTRIIAEREAKDLKDIEARLGELQGELTKMLAEVDPTAGKPTTMEMFPETTDDATSRARRSIESRLQELPNELKHEQASIRRRYAEPQHRMFPVAVSVLIPEGGR